MKIEDELKSKFRNDYHKLMVNIFLTSTRLGDKFQKSMKVYDITPAQYNVLRILRGQNQKAVSVGLIKERMIDRNSDTSRIIERLVQKKLIERTENTEDRRQKDVRITTKGLNVLSEIDACEQAMDQHLMHLTPEEVKTMSTLLDKLRNPLNNEVEL